VTLGLVLGQDTPFWLLFAATGLLWLSRGRPRLAGAVFTLCICKYHLAVGLPILLAAQKRWKALASAAAAGAILLGACFWIEGLAWPLRYWEAINHPDFSPAAPRMANLRALAWWLPWPGVVEAVLAILVAYLLWSFCRRTQCLALPPPEPPPPGRYWDIMAMSTTTLSSSLSWSSHCSAPQFPPG